MTPRRPLTPAFNARKLSMSIASIALLLAFFLSPPAHAHAITGAIGNDGTLLLSGPAPFEANAGNVALDELDKLGMIDLGLDTARNNTVDQLADEVLYALAVDEITIDAEIGLIVSSRAGLSAVPSTTGHAMAAAVGNSVPDASNTGLFMLAVVSGLLLISGLAGGLALPVSNRWTRI